MILTAERIILRPFCVNDAETVANICNDKNFSKYIPLPFPYTLQDAKDWIKSQPKQRNQKSFAIVLKENNQLFGSISINLDKSKQNAEIGYWIKPEMSGKGYATEAVKKILEYGFEKLNLHKIYAKHYVENIASGKVMKKSGMSYVGILKKHSFKNGIYHDDCLYEIVNPHD